MNLAAKSCLPPSDTLRINFTKSGQCTVRLGMSSKRHRRFHSSQNRWLCNEQKGFGVYFDFNLKGLVPALVVMAVLSLFGIWKLVSIVAWIASHLRWE